MVVVLDNESRGFSKEIRLCGSWHKARTTSRRRTAGEIVKVEIPVKDTSKARRIMLNL